MKKTLLTLMAFAGFMTATQAKVVKITLTDGTQKVVTSSELSAIDFNEDGTLTLTSYNGEELTTEALGYTKVEINDEAAVCEQFNDTLAFNIDVDGLPVNLNSERPVNKINYVYPSTDPFGEPITLSGTILIPDEVWEGKNPCNGILMVNHYTKFHRNEAPTRDNGELERMLLANPLKPNYIIVESDFYGFGATERFPQAFVQGTYNARTSLDGLLAARDLLDQMGFDYGTLLFNIGYSSGGYDALAAQKVRDMEYADRISFDKTFSGGGPSLVSEAYRQYVLIDSTAYNAVPLLLMVCTKETQRLDLDYDDVFQPDIAGRIDELILSKNYSSWPVCDSIGRDKKVHEILSETYCDLNSPESQAIQEVLRDFDLNKDDWTPDPTQRIYLFHSRGDDYVPIKCARPMIPFFKSKGFEPSIIPGKTNLQTNFIVPNMGHLSATLIYFIQTLSAITAWPAIYNGNIPTDKFYDIIKQDVDAVTMMRMLDENGFNCREIINSIKDYLEFMAETNGIDEQAIQTILEGQLAKLGLTTQDLVEMSEDSGIDIRQFFNDLATYLNEQPEEETAESAAPKKAARLIKALDEGITPAQKNEKILRDWLKDYIK